MDKDLFDIEIGKNFPEIVNVIIEIPKASHNKYEFDKERGVFRLDRVLYSPVYYPADYGFIPQTIADDGDPLDILVIGDDPLFVGCLLEARPIGLLKMVDNDEKDLKVLAVQKANPRFNTITTLESLKDLDSHLLDEIANFFEVYKKLEGKKTIIKGWNNELEAKKEIEKAFEVYQKYHK
jgi:inorganic pyrophosphatase